MTISRVAVALIAAATLFAAGALGPLRSTGREPGPAPAGVEVAAAATITGEDLDSTIAQLRARARARPGDARSQALLGIAYVNKARLSFDPSYYESAEAALDRSLAGRKNNFEGVLGKGMLALARHRFAEGLRWGRRAAALRPLSAEALGVVGDAYTELGRYDMMVRTFQRMVDLRPNLASYARVSYARQLLGDTKGAIAAMRRALESAGADAADAAWASFQLGELYHDGGRLERARRAFARGVALDPSSEMSRVGLAEVAANRGNFHRSIAKLRTISARVPSPHYAQVLGDVYAAAGRHDAARRAYERVTDLQEHFASYGVDIALEQAVFDADRGVRIEAAVRTARAEYEERRSVEVADALAWTLYRSGRFAEADAYAREGLRLGTEQATFHYHAGLIAKATGREGAAVRHLSAALELNPHFSLTDVDRARRALGTLTG